MEAAFHRARETPRTFLDPARTSRPTITSMAVKVAVRDGSDTEYFWIRPFTEQDGSFVSKINNTPRSVHNVKLGQTIAFKRSDIVDWLYRENGKDVRQLHRMRAAQARAAVRSRSVQAGI
jgi:uncharacterized protein YegJ (DUF2314 family)